MAKYKPKLQDDVKFIHTDNKEHTGTIYFISSNKKFVGLYPNSVYDWDVLCDTDNIKEVIK